MLNPETGLVDSDVDAQRKNVNPWSDTFKTAANGISAIIGGDKAALGKVASYGFGALGIPDVVSEPLVDLALGGLKFAINAIFGHKKRYFAKAPIIRRCNCRITTQDGKDHYREGICIQAAQVSSSQSESQAKKGLKSILADPSKSEAWATGKPKGYNPQPGEPFDQQKTVMLNQIDADNSPAIIIFPRFQYLKEGYGKFFERNGLQYLLAFLAGKPLGIWGDGVFADREIRPGIFNPNYDASAFLVCRRIPEPGSDRVKGWFDVTEVYNPGGTTAHFTDSSDSYVFLTTPSANWHSATHINGTDVRLTTLMAIVNWGNGRKIEEISENYEANLWFDSPAEAQPRDLLAAAFGVQSMWTWERPKERGVNKLQTCAEITTQAYPTAEAVSTGVQQSVTGWTNQIFPPIVPLTGAVVPSTDRVEMGDDTGSGIEWILGIAAFAFLLFTGKR